MKHFGCRISQVAAAFAFCAIVAAPTSAQDDAAPTSDGRDGSAQAAPAAGTGAGAGQLQGGIQKVHVSLADLKTVGLDLKNVLKAVSSLYDEVTIQPVEVVTEPEFIGMGNVINIPISTRPVGPPAPARKDRVDLAMSHIKPTIKMLNDNVQQFITGHKQLDWPAALITEVDPELKTWAQNVEKLAAQEAELEKLTASSPYNQPEIAQQCVSMEESIKTLEKTRKTVYKIVHKHAKELNAISTAGS